MSDKPLHQRTTSSPRLTASLPSEGPDRRDTGTVAGGANYQTTERPDYWDGYHQAMLGHDRKPEGGAEYQRGYTEGNAAFQNEDQSDAG